MNLNPHTLLDADLSVTCLHVTFHASIRPSTFRHFRNIALTTSILILRQELFQPRRVRPSNSTTVAPQEPLITRRRLLQPPRPIPIGLRLTKVALIAESAQTVLVHQTPLLALVAA